MRNGICMETECKNLKELNAELKRTGRDYHIEYCGFMMSANGYKERTYIAIDDNGIENGTYFNIAFNC